MHRTLASFLAPLALSTHALAQNWQLQSPIPGRADFYSVAFNSPNHGFVVGSQNHVCETSDGGATWTLRTLGGLIPGALNSDPFYTVSFANSTNGWIFGNNNQAFRTTSGGSTWTRMTSMFAGSWIEAEPISPTQVFAAWQGYAFTPDNGTTWDLRSNYTNSPWAQGLDFLNANTGLAVGHTYDPFATGPTPAGVFKTTDGGRTWSHKSDFASTDVLWLDSTTALVSYINDTITEFYISTDSGETWSYLSSLGNGLAPTAIDNFVRVSPSTLAAVTNLGGVWISNDLGQSWHETFTELGISGLPNFVRWTITFPDATTGYLAGPTGLIFRSDDSGETWRQVSNGAADEIRGIEMLNESFGLACTYFGYVLRTTDGGAHWSVITKLSVTGQVFGRDEHLTALDILDENLAIIAGEGGVIFRSTDAGLTWDSVGWPNSSVTGIFAAATVRMVDASRGFVAGNDMNFGLDGSVYRTDDGGLSWYVVTEPVLPSAYWVGIDFVDSLNGWIATGGSMVYRTTDGGDTWTPAGVSSIYNPGLSAIDFASPLVGYASDYWGYMHITNDGGKTFTGFTEDPQFHFLGVSAVSPTEAIAIVYDEGNFRRLLKRTVDAGKTWTTITYPTAWDKNYLSPHLVQTLPSGNTFFAGYGGLIARATFERPCLADYNRDAFSDAIDYDRFIADWVMSKPLADINADGFIDAIDYDIFIAAWSTGC